MTSDAPTTTTTHPRLAFIGGGVMGEALLAGVLASGWDSENVSVAEPSALRANELSAKYGVRAADGNAATVSRVDIVVVAVKPKYIGGVLEDIAGSLRPGTLVISVAAGVTCSFYEERLPAGTAVVRVMPNTPAVIGKGASAISPGTHATEEHLALTERVLAKTGLVVRADEHDLDAVTAISGSGPAYVFYFIDALAEAGVLLGLTRDLSTKLAVATVLGSASLVDETGDHPAILRERVSSPGGTTDAGVSQLDAHGVRAGIVAAATATRDRSLQLAAEAASASHGK